MGSENTTASHRAAVVGVRFLGWSQSAPSMGSVRSTAGSARTCGVTAAVLHRTALDRRGRLLAMEIDVLLDGGAYTTLSPVVLSRAVLHAAGPYRCEHVRITGRVVKTNTPPNGAFRGFGVPQVAFALERHMDRVAAAAGLDRVELRRRNLLADGETTATGQSVVSCIASSTRSSMRRPRASSPLPNRFTRSASCA